MRYSVNVATKNIEFSTRSQAIYDDDNDNDNDTQVVYNHREICLYLFRFRDKIE